MSQDQQALLDRIPGDTTEDLLGRIQDEPQPQGPVDLSGFEPIMQGLNGTPAGPGPPTTPPSGGEPFEPLVRGMELGGGRALQFLGEAGQRAINALPDWMQGGRTRAELAREVQRAGQPGKAVIAQGLTHPEPTSFLGKTTQGIGTALPAVVAGAVNPPLGAAALGAMAGGSVEDRYNETLKATGSDVKATEAALAEIPIQALYFAPIARIFMGSTAGASLARKALDGAVTGVIGPGSAKILGEVVGEQITQEDKAQLGEALKRGAGAAVREAPMNAAVFGFLHAAAGIGEPAGGEHLTPEKAAADKLASTEPTPIYGSLPKEAVQTQGPLQLTEGAPRELPAGTTREPRRPAGPLPAGEQPITLGRSPSPKGPEEMTAGEVQLPGPPQGPPPRIIPQPGMQPKGERPPVIRPSIASASQDPALVEIAQRYVSGGERGKLDAREMLQDSLREFLTPQDIHDIASGPKEATAEPAAIPRKPPQEPPQPAAEPTANPSEMAANASTLAEPSGTEAPKAETAAAPIEAPPQEAATSRQTGEARPPGLPTSTKNAITEQERAMRGEPPLEETLHKAWGESLDTARAAMAKDPSLIERVVKGESTPELTLDERQAALDSEKVTAFNERDRLAQAALENADKPEAFKAIEKQRQAVSDRLLELDKATKTSGSELGRGLAIRRMMVARDYSIAAIETEFRLAKGGDRLTPEETAKAEDLSRRLIAAEKQVNEIEAELATKQANKSMALAPGRKAKVLSFLDAQANEARARLAAKRGQAGGGLPFDPQDIADIARIAASHIAHGIDAGARLLADFGEAVRPHLEAILAQARGLHRDAILGPQTGKAPPDVLGMRSALEDAAVSKLPEKGGAGQMLKTLENAGISSEEMEWSGIKDFLKGKLSVSKQEVLDYLKQSNVKVEEKALGESPTQQGSITDLPNGKFRVSFPSLQDELYGERGLAISRLSGLRRQFGADDTKFSQYQLPGGTNYRELLLSLPVRGIDARKAIFDKYAPDIARANDAIHSAPSETARHEAMVKRHALEDQRDSEANAAGPAPKEGSVFTGGHFSDQATNVLAHLRVNDRTTAEGKKMLFIEEVQSDWHQKGRKQGYGPTKETWWAVRPGEAQGMPFGSEASARTYAAEHPEMQMRVYQTPAGGIPDAPFKKTWHELALKRAIRYAAENGYDSVGWTTGAQQVDRYNEAMRQNVDKIEVEPRGAPVANFDRMSPSLRAEYERQGITTPTKAGHVYVRAHKNGQERFGAEVPLEGTANIHGHDVALEDVVGKDIADKIRSKPTEKQTFEGEGLAIGGAGMKGFYDKMLPAAAEKIGKVGGAKVEDASLRNEYVPPGNRAPQRFPDTPVHSIDITPALRTVATEQGFPRFGTEPAKASQPAILEFIGKQADAARLRIKERGPRAGALGDLAQMKDYAIIGADYLAKDVTKFADWSSAMLKEFGDTIKPHLQDIYDKAREYLAATPKQAGSEKAAITRATKTASKLRAKTAAQDFEPEPKPEPLPMTPERLKAKADLEEARKEYESARSVFRFKNRTLGEKTRDVAKELVNIPKQIMTAYDMSAVLRQGGMLTLGRPVEAVKAFPKMFGSAVSERSALETDVAIRNRPHAELGNKAGLELTQLEGPLYKHEEHIRSAWANKIPGIAGSNRAFTTFLNLQRSQAFDAMVDALPGGTPTPEQAKAIANFVNVASGRGNPGKFAASVSAASDVLWSPRLLLSRFQLLAGQPLYRGDMATRKAIATQYARSLAGLAAVYALGKLAGGDIEDDPRSSDFGKIKLGNTRVDPLAGLAQVTVLGSRITTGETVNPEGKTTPLRPPIFGEGKGPGFGQSNTSDVLSRFLRTKLSPTLGVPIDVLSGKDVTGQPVTPLSAAENLAVPLSFSDILKAMEDQGIPKGIALGILSTFGMGVQTYQDAQPKPKKFKGLGMPRLR